MRQHTVRIDAISPPPVQSRAANGSHKGALLPSPRTACQLSGRQHTAGCSTHPSFCAAAGHPLVLSLAQADLAAAQVPAGVAEPPCSRLQHGETGPGSVQQQHFTSSGHVWCERICFPALQLCGNLCGVLNTLGNTITYLDFCSKWPKRSLCQHSLPPSSSQNVVTSHNTVE